MYGGGCKSLLEYRSICSRDNLQHGNVLQLAQNLINFDRDVIEIRLLKRNNEREKQYDDDKGENTDEPDEDESSDDDGMDCTICFEGRREVVLKP